MLARQHLLVCHIGDRCQLNNASQKDYVSQYWSADKIMQLFDQDLMGRIAQTCSWCWEEMSWACRCAMVPCRWLHCLCASITCCLTCPTCTPTQHPAFKHKYRTMAPASQTLSTKIGMQYWFCCMCKSEPCLTVLGDVLAAPGQYCMTVELT